MNKEIDRPESNEAKVTYTYDDNDRLLYRNVYDGDRPSNREIGFGGATIFTSNNFKPKKLLYQDVYTYNNMGTKDIKRIYQPTIDISGVRDGNGYGVFTSNITCKSKVLASGFIYDESLENLLVQFLYPSNLFNSTTFKGINATGTITTTITNTNEIHVKAYAMIETGTLFSKTLTLPVL